ncbi:hypothetical protein OBV_11840 [Oscillibacter valericigenes Sjm18-20]|nr:hypothetical protein OBV_11840 [Oscillibacter valericigenes Sjm18-20]
MTIINRALGGQPCHVTKKQQREGVRHCARLPRAALQKYACSLQETARKEMGGRKEREIKTSALPEIQLPAA